MYGRRRSQIKPKTEPKVINSSPLVAPVPDPSVSCVSVVQHEAPPPSVVPDSNSNLNPIDAVADTSVAADAPISDKADIENTVEGTNSLPAPTVTSSSARRLRFRAKPNIAGLKAQPKPFVQTNDPKSTDNVNSDSEVPGANKTNYSDVVCALAESCLSIVPTEIRHDSDSTATHRKSDLVPTPSVAIPPCSNEPSTSQSVVVEQHPERENIVLNVVKSKLGRKYTGQEPLDRTKFKMSDLVAWNPVNEPTLYPKKTLKSKENSRTTATSKAEAAQKPERGPKNEAKLKQEAHPHGDGPPANLADSLPAPQIRIGDDGQVMIDESSLVVQSSQKKILFEEIVDGSGERTTSASHRKRIRARVHNWTKKELDRFYLALAAIGPDFTLMQPFFAPLTRNELKKRYLTEERKNRARVDSAFFNRIELNNDVMQRLSYRSEDEVESDTESGKRKPKSESANSGEKPPRKKRSRKKDFDEDFVPDGEIPKKNGKSRKPNKRQLTLSMSQDDTCVEQRLDDCDMEEDDDDLEKIASEVLRHEIEYTSQRAVTDDQKITALVNQKLDAIKNEGKMKKSSKTVIIRSKNNAFPPYVSVKPSEMKKVKKIKPNPALLSPKSSAMFATIDSVIASSQSIVTAPPEIPIVFAKPNPLPDPDQLRILAESINITVEEFTAKVASRELFLVQEHDATTNSELLHVYSYQKGISVSPNKACIDTAGKLAEASSNVEPLSPVHVSVEQIEEFENSQPASDLQELGGPSSTTEQSINQSEIVQICNFSPDDSDEDDLVVAE